MLHFKGSRLSQDLIPHVVGSADRETRISRRRLDINFFEWRFGKNFPIGHAVVGDAAGKTESIYAVKLVQPVEHAEHGDFEPGLQRGRDILMALFNRRAYRSFTSEPL